MRRHWPSRVASDAVGGINPLDKSSHEPLASGAFKGALMTRTSLPYLKALLISLAIVALATCAAPARLSPPAQSVVAFVHVTLIPAYGDPAIEDATVIVRDSHIAQIGRNLRVPPGARVVGHRGQFLAPGLADMHVHIFNPDDGALYLANCVTSVRNMAGRPETLALAERIRSGDVAGPYIYSSGPILDGVTADYVNPHAITTVAEMTSAIAQTAAAGYIAAKLYENLTPELFARGVAEARAHGLEVYAHVPLSMSVRDVLALRIDSIEHLTGFDRALAPLSHSDWDQERWTEAQPALMAPLAREVAASGVWNAATLVTWLDAERAFADIGAAEAGPLYRYASLRLRRHWRDIYDDERQRHDPAQAWALARQGHGARLAMVRALHAAGAPLLIGTDAPQPFLYPGFSFQDELGFHRDAGISNRDILRAASIDAARFLHREGEFGAVVVGARADLLLLNADPDADLASLRTPAGVMAAGRWYDAAALQALLDNVAAQIRAQTETPGALPH